MNVLGRQGFCVCGDSDAAGDVDASAPADLLGLSLDATANPDSTGSADFDTAGRAIRVNCQEWLTCYRSWIGSATAAPPGGRNPVQVREGGGRPQVQDGLAPGSRRSR